MTDRADTYLIINLDSTSGSQRTRAADAWECAQHFSWRNAQHQAKSCVQQMKSGKWEGSKTPPEPDTDLPPDLPRCKEGGQGGVPILFFKVVIHRACRIVGGKEQIVHLHHARMHPSQVPGKKDQLHNQRKRCKRGLGILGSGVIASQSGRSGT